MTINWKQIGKKADGSIGKKARILMRGVGRLAAGQFSASVDCGVVESSSGGPAKAVLQWRRNGNTAPVVWQEDCACLETAEIVIEDEGIPAMGRLLAKEGEKDLHPSDVGKKAIALKSWEQIA